MSRLVTLAMRSFTSGKKSARILWALSLCPMPGDERGNEHISDLLLDAVHSSGLSIAQVLNQESGEKVLRYLPQQYARIVPNYRQFLKFMDRLGDGGRFQRELAKYEEELLYQANFADLDDIANDSSREMRNTEFSMKLKMTGLLSKRRKDKGEADIVDEVAKQSVMNGLSNEQLAALDAKLIDVTAEEVEDDSNGET